MRASLCSLLLVFTALATAQDTDPKIYVPNSETVWNVGDRYQISWNSSFRLPDDLYYNSFTRLTLQLHQQRGRKSDFVMTIATDYPFALGYIYWTVPQNSSGPGIRPVTIGAAPADAKYFLKIYPTFFDWPRSCSGCTDAAPRSSFFTILPNECSDFACVNGGEAGPSAVTGANDPFNAYLDAMKSVAVGVGVVAALFFTISFFVYTKKGWKSWEQYRSRKNGMQYKYRPSGMNGPRGPSGGASTNSNLFSTFSTSSDALESTGTRIDGFDSSYRPPGSSFLDMGFGSQMDEDFIESDADRNFPPTASSSITLPHHAKIPTLRDPSRFEIPPRRPPRPYTPPPVQPLTGSSDNGECSVGEEMGSIRPPPLAHHPDHQMLGSPPSNSIIKESEANLVGHTFRNALRVSYEDDQQETRRKSINDSATSDCAFEREFLPPEMAAEMENSCSPVLSQLALIDHN